YVRVKGRWTYLYRAVDSSGATIDFLLAARRNTAAAKRFFQCIACSRSPARQSDQRRRQPVVPQGGCGTKGGGKAGPALSLSYLSLLEQHSGTGSSGDQTTGQRQPGVPILSRSPADDPRI